MPSCILQISTTRSCCPHGNRQTASRRPLGIRNFSRNLLAIRACASSSEESESTSEPSIASEERVSLTFSKGSTVPQPGRTASAATRALEAAWLDGRGRIGMMMMASKGALDRSPKYVKREETPGKLLTEMLNWPSPYTFTVVGPGGAEEDAFKDDMLQLVAHICEVDPDQIRCSVTPRMAGKFVSVQMVAVVASAEAVAEVFEALGQDSRVKMKF